MLFVIFNLWLIFFQAEDKLSFTVQILEEMVVLFEEDNSKASWEEIKEENFLQVVTQVADGLRSCVSLTVDWHVLLVP